MAKVILSEEELKVNSKRLDEKGIVRRAVMIIEEEPDQDM